MYTYYVIQNDTSGICSSDPVDLEVTVIQGIEASVSVTDVSCYGYSDGTAEVSVTDNGNGPFTYSWSDGTTSTSMTGQPAGEYTVTILDQNFCLRVMNAIITSPTEMTLNLDKSNNLCFGDQNSLIATNVSGSVPPYSYSWSDGSADDQISGLADGSYSVTVTDDNGCTKSEGVTITTPEEIMIDYTMTKENCNGSYDGEIHLNVTGGIATHYYTWPEGSYDTVATGLHNGTYNISVLDSNNCEKSVNLQLQSVYDFCLVPANVLTPNGDGKNDFWRIEFIELNPGATVIVFDRNGKKVFESTNYGNNTADAWDGTCSGTELPMGSYYYIITMGTDDPITGYVDIIR